MKRILLVLAIAVLLTSVPTAVLADPPPKNMMPDQAWDAIIEGQPWETVMELFGKNGNYMALMSVDWVLCGYGSSQPWGMYAKHLQSPQW